jgi:hypothetical protein
MICCEVDITRFLGHKGMGMMAMAEGRPKKPECRLWRIEVLSIDGDD